MSKKCNIKYTIRVKPEENPKEFKEGMGKGVLLVQEEAFTFEEKNIPHLSAAVIYDHGQVLLRRFIEVVYKEVIDLDVGVDSSKMSEIIRELQNMIMKSKSPLMDNSHIFDKAKARKLLEEFNDCM